MHSAIIVVTMPDQQQAWDNFTGQLAVKVKPGENVQRLAESVWQVNFQKEAAALAWILVGCERFGLEYGILPLEAEPKWLWTGPDPKPK